MRPSRNPGHRDHDHGGNDIRLALLALARIERKLSTLKLQGAQLMALSKQTLDMLAEIDADTTSISDKIQRLLDNPSTTEAEFRTALAPIAERLDALGKDPENPVPLVDPVRP